MSTESTPRSSTLARYNTPGRRICVCGVRKLWQHTSVGIAGACVGADRSIGIRIHVRAADVAGTAMQDCVVGVHGHVQMGLHDIVITLQTTKATPDMIRRMVISRCVSTETDSRRICKIFWLPLLTHKIVRGTTCFTSSRMQSMSSAVKSKANLPACRSPPRRRLKGIQSVILCKGGSQNLHSLQCFSATV